MKTWEQILTQSDCVVDAEAAENFLYVSRVKETVSFDHNLERFWGRIKRPFNKYVFLALEYVMKWSNLCQVAGAKRAYV